MASLQVPLMITAAHLYGNNPTTNTSCSSTLQFFLNQQKPNHALKNKLSCRAAKESTRDQEDGNNVERGKFDRREILLGLGGLYGTSAVSQSALAAPVEPTNCGNADLPDGTDIKDGNCCPPASPTPIIDYHLPNDKMLRPFRVRRAAHLVDQNYIDKYNEAMRIMRSLPEDHPHSFAQQAAIHCAYCHSAYEMVNFPVKLDVHFSWLFFPFHRWYLYFFEKILGKLIGDPYFAIPYWNWDSPEGMQMPLMFANPYSPLYDKLRNDKHYPPVTVDLNYSNLGNSVSEAELIENNLAVMYTQMVNNSATRKQFFGGEFQGGDGNMMGSIEDLPHTPVHIWTGDPNQPNQEDMGRFYSAGRDPIFYAHHANVDRMWNIWKDMDVRHKDIDDPDWLNSSFLLYDEYERLVRVKIKDCLNTARLGYTYEDVPLPWLDFHPAPKPVPKDTQVYPMASDFFPKVLGDVLKFTVPRPKKSRTKEEKEIQEEMLVVDGIEYDGDEYVKFDVYINGYDEVWSGPGYAGFSGVYSNVPSTKNIKVKATQLFGLTKLLEDLEADDDDNVMVALVPITGQGKVTIGSAKIVLSDY